MSTSRDRKIHFLCLYLSTLSDCIKVWTLDELTKTKKKRPQIQTDLRERETIARGSGNEST
jgi:hypothetical protein